MAHPHLSSLASEAVNRFSSAQVSFFSEFVNTGLRKTLAKELTQVFIDKEPRVDHSHDIPAQFRTGADKKIRSAIMAHGRIPYDFGSSDRPAIGGNDGARTFHGDKDLAQKYKYTKLTKEHIGMMIDVDYYPEDLGVRIARGGVPWIMFSFCPEKPAGVSRDSRYTWTTNDDGSITMRVSGGAVYTHKLWAWHQRDHFTVKTAMTVTMCKVDTYYVNRNFDPNWRYVLIVPEVRINRLSYGLHTWLVKHQVVSLRRLNTIIKATLVNKNKSGNKTTEIRMGVTYTVEKGSTVLNMAYAGSTRVYRCPAGPVSSCLAEIQLAENEQLAGSKVRMILGPEVMELTEGDNKVTRARPAMDREDLAKGPLVDPVATVITPLFHLARAWSKDASFTPPCMFEVGRALAPAFSATHPNSEGFEESTKFKGVRFAQPITMEESMFPVETRDNQMVGVSERITGVANKKIATKFIMECADEFVERIVPHEQVGTFFPLTLEQVIEGLPTPTRKARAAAVEDVLHIYSEPKDALVDMFIKSESYPGGKAPRLISQVEQEHNLMMSRFTLGFKKCLKQWGAYVPGKTPVQVAQAIADMASNASELEESDYSSMDGTVSAFMQSLVRKCYLRGIPSEYASEFVRFFDAEINCKAKSKLGVTYYPKTARLSGSPQTTDGNTIITMFHCYLTFRVDVGANLSPDRAWEALNNSCLCNGDDVAKANTGKALEVTAESLGLLAKRKLITKESGETLSFLGRDYLPWETDEAGCAYSIKDIPRAAPGLGLSAKSSVPLPVAAIMKCGGLLATDLSTPIIASYCSAVIARYAPIVCGDTSMAEYAPMAERAAVLANAAQMYGQGETPDVDFFAKSFLSNLQHLYLTGRITANSVAYVLRENAAFPSVTPREVAVRIARSRLPDVDVENYDAILFEGGAAVESVARTINIPLTHKVECDVISDDTWYVVGPATNNIIQSDVLLDNDIFDQRHRRSGPTSPQDTTGHPSSTTQQDFDELNRERSTSATETQAQGTSTLASNHARQRPTEGVRQEEARQETAAGGGFKTTGQAEETETTRQQDTNGTYDASSDGGVRQPTQHTGGHQLEEHGFRSPPTSQLGNSHVGHQLQNREDIRGPVDTRLSRNQGGVARGGVEPSGGAVTLQHGTGDRRLRTPHGGQAARSRQVEGSPLLGITGLASSARQQSLGHAGSVGGSAGETKAIGPIRVSPDTTEVKQRIVDSAEGWDVRPPSRLVSNNEQGLESSATRQSAATGATSDNNPPTLQTGELRPQRPPRRRDRSCTVNCEINLSSGTTEIGTRTSEIGPTRSEQDTERNHPLIEDGAPEERSGGLGQPHAPPSLAEDRQVQDSAPMPGAEGVLPVAGGQSDGHSLSGLRTQLSPGRHTPFEWVRRGGAVDWSEDGDEHLFVPSGEGNADDQRTARGLDRGWPEDPTDGQAAGGGANGGQPLRGLAEGQAPSRPAGEGVRAVLPNGGEHHDHRANGGDFTNVRNVPGPLRTGEERVFGQGVREDYAGGLRVPRLRVSITGTLRQISEVPRLLEPLRGRRGIEISAGIPTDGDISAGIHGAPILSGGVATRGGWSGGGASEGFDRGHAGEVRPGNHGDAPGNSGRAKRRGPRGQRARGRPAGGVGELVPGVDRVGTATHGSQFGDELLHNPGLHGGQSGLGRGQASGQQGFAPPGRRSFRAVGTVVRGGQVVGEGNGGGYHSGAGILHGARALPQKGSGNRPGRGKAKDKGNPNLDREQGGPILSRSRVPEVRNGNSTPQRTIGLGTEKVEKLPETPTGRDTVRAGGGTGHGGRVRRANVRRVGGLQEREGEPLTAVSPSTAQSVVEPAKAGELLRVNPSSTDSVSGAVVSGGVATTVPGGQGENILKLGKARKRNRRSGKKAASIEAGASGAGGNPTLPSVQLT